MKIALSLLCENPLRRTGLTTAYHEFVSCSLRLFPDVSWVVFVGPNQEWSVHHRNVEVVRDFPAGDQLKRRLFADHFQVPAAASVRGADVMVSTGFVPIRKCLPTVMHILSLQHMDKGNRIGLARELYRRFVTSYTWPKADLIITNSKFAVSQIVAFFPEFQNRLVQAYEGLQHEQFNTVTLPDELARLKAEAGLEPGYFLWLSNFYSYKQADLLVSAYALLDADTRRNHPLAMVGGEWKTERAACQEKVRAMGLSNDVKFLGWVGDNMLAPLYRKAVAHCLPSREETFGRTVIESMACGTPCIVNDIPIMHEVTNGHALIVDFKDAKKAADALLKIARDQNLHAQLREAGQARAQQFSFERFTTERIVAIRRLVSKQRPP